MDKLQNETVIMSNPLVHKNTFNESRG